MEDEEIEVDCNACNTIYTIIFNERELRGEPREDTTFHCAFCGILMEPYVDDIEY
jgi:hypothetical protein